LDEGAFGVDVDDAELLLTLEADEVFDFFIGFDIETGAS
jgi:hypothetical protein